MELTDVLFVNEIRNLYAEEYLHDSSVFTFEESLSWFKNTNPKYFIIFYNNDRIGYFRTSNWSNANSNVYIGADLHPEWVGKKLSYNAYKVFIKSLFDYDGMNKVSLEVLATNRRAISLYKKLGFKLDGIKREEVFKKGEFVDSYIMSILKSEWK